MNCSHRIPEEEFKHLLDTLNQARGHLSMDLLPVRQTCGLRMHQECRERFPRHRLKRKQLISDPGMYHGTCMTPVP